VINDFQKVRNWKKKKKKKKEKSFWKVSD